MTLITTAKNLSVSAVLSALFLMNCLPAEAKLDLDGMFNDHMVLQANQPITIWGTGTPNDTVGIKVGERKAIAKVDAQGEWKMTLEPLAPGGPYELTAVASHDKLTFRDVYVGEVWLCSGQANMTATMKEAGKGSNGADKVANGAAQLDPRIRFVTVPTKIAIAPQKEFNAQWNVLDQSNAENFPSLPFHFANRINKELNVPVGIIICAAAGSPIEAWMSREAFATFPEGKNVIPNIEQQYVRAVKSLRGAHSSTSGPPPAQGAVATPPAQNGMTVEDIASALQNSASALNAPVGSSQAGTGSTTVTSGQTVSAFGAPGSATTANAATTTTASAATATTATGSAVTTTASAAATTTATGAATTTLTTAGTTTTASGTGTTTPGAQTTNTIQVPISILVPPIAKDERKDAKKPDLRNVANLNVSAATSLFNGMVAPVIPYGIKGILWYQGEANFVTKKYDNYHKFFAALVRDWRAKWQPTTPTVLFVQLPGLGPHEPQPNAKNAVADMRERQAQGVLVPSTYMVVALDSSEGSSPGFDDTNKTLIGERLALTALATQYNKKYAYRGPSFDSYTVEGNKLRLHFRHTAHGLKMKGDKLKGFAIAGDDKQLHWADGSIEGDSVILSAPEVLHPTMVTYGWQSNPEANLYNGDDLPAAPFKKRIE